MAHRLYIILSVFLPILSNLLPRFLGIFENGDVLRSWRQNAAFLETDRSFNLIFPDQSVYCLDYVLDLCIRENGRVNSADVARIRATAVNLEWLCIYCN